MYSISDGQYTKYVLLATDVIYKCVLLATGSTQNMFY